MKKFGQILALVFMLAFGYGLGQHTQDLFATDYPGGGAGGGTHPVNLASDVTGELPHASTSDDAANVHGLGASVNVLGDLDASGNFIQSGTVNPGAGDAGAATIYAITLTAVTFGTAFSAAPVVVTGGTVDITKIATGAEAVTTTGFSITGFTNASSFNPTDLDWIALGT